jgi:3-deoxy-manno-octulosonate cytidylyltransferase (CMP-KDO synthetase)
VEADVGPVVVAAADAAILRAVEAAGGRAVLTDPGHPSGSDRIREAVDALDPGGRHDGVVNIQGDLPTIEPEAIRAALAAAGKADIGTIAAVIVEEGERTDPNVVKAVVELAEGARTGRALYFTRATAPSGPGPILHHIGLYAWRRQALARFVALPPSALERREKLEQLRALAAGMRIDVALVDTVPLGVDTPADLARARRMLAANPPRQEREPGR